MTGQFDPSLSFLDNGKSIPAKDFSPTSVDNMLMIKYNFHVIHTPSNITDKLNTIWQIDTTAAILTAVLILDNNI